MGSPLPQIFLLSLLATLNPSLLAAVTVMLLLPHPKRVMASYLLGTYAMGITAGLVIAFSLHSSGAVRTSKHTLSPAADIVIGLVAFVIAIALGTGRDAPIRELRERRRQAKQAAGKTKEPWQQRMLGGGTARAAVAVGAALSLPGVTYLNALSHIVKLNPGTALTVLLVVYFCVMQQILLEVPLLSHVFAPEWTRTSAVTTEPPADVAA